MKVKDLIEKLQEVNRPDSEVVFTSIGDVTTFVALRRTPDQLSPEETSLDSVVDVFGLDGNDPPPGAFDNECEVTIWLQKKL